MNTNEYITYQIYVPDHSEISEAHRYMRSRANIPDNLATKAEALVAMGKLAWVGDEWRCWSQGSHGRSYRVTLVGCDCPSFAQADYVIKESVYCKHKLALWVYRVILEMDLQERCRGDGHSRSLRRSIQRRTSVAFLSGDNMIVRLLDHGETWSPICRANYYPELPAYKLKDERAMYDYARYLGEILADYQNESIPITDDDIYAAAVAAGHTPESAVAIAETPAPSAPSVATVTTRSAPIMAALAALYQEGD